MNSTTPARPLVSVIIPAFNAAATLPEQLAALAVQTFDEAWEVLVADNGSSDETPRVVRAAAEDFPVSLNLVKAGDRQGAGHARNTGALNSRGEYLMFCDADDVVDRDWVRRGARALTNSDVVAGATRELRTPVDPAAPLVFPDVWAGRSGTEVVMSGNLAVRRSSYFRAGGFDESLPPYGGEDVEFSLRLHKCAAVVSRDSGMVVYFRRTTNTRTLLSKVYRSGKSEPLVWDRHPDLFTRSRTLRAATVSLVVYPAALLRGYRRGERLNSRQSAREFVVRAGHVAAYLPGGTRANDSAPQLLGASDDPLLSTTEDATS